MNSDLLIYSSFDSVRLQYILQWIFTEQMGLAYRLTTDIEVWNHYPGPKISYSRDEKIAHGLPIFPHSLLKEDNIKIQELTINRWKHSTILFYNQPGALVPFDIFAAVFYLISRYEEYLDHQKDKHGRYPHEQSIAAQYAFLQQPVVDEWLLHFKQVLEDQFGIRSIEKKFRFIPTYDIDIAWKYLNKGNKRRLGGYFRDIVRWNIKDIAERSAVLSGKKKDPYDCFKWLDQIHQQYQLQPIYFLLLGQLSDYDKNADPGSLLMQELMQSLSAQYDTGIHPSYESHKKAAILKAEIGLLSGATHNTVTKSRQHYIKFALPETYEILIAAGITDDYSMGYASCNGFRAGTSNAFPWYNLKENNATDLRIHPFAFMEVTCKFYKRLGPDEAWKEWERLWYAVKKVNGTFISIWHNHILGTHRESKGWRELYEKILKVK